ncbi:MAG TPA: flippase-like domain-containing protein [Steroidobacteraceae bacterium]|nr:flippase-like domain-containing protein [Steroidobacteraceae bacterium]
MSSASEKRSFRGVGTLIGGILGLSLAAWMLWSYGAARVIEVLVRAGWLGTLAVVAFHLPQMLFAALGWKTITGPCAAQSPLRTYLLLRWIREGIDNLLPVAQIGGECVAARLLQRRGVPLASAVSSTIADLLMEIATEIPFAVLGLALLLHFAGESAVAVLVARVLLFASLVLAGVFAALGVGLTAAIERRIVRLGCSLGWPATARIEGLHDALKACYWAPGRVVLAALWHLASWLLGGLEVWLILHLFGHDIGLGPALVIESMGQVSKSLGFAIPGAVGVQEGGYLVVCGLLGISPEVGLATSLMKRLREVVWGVPALVAWHWAETNAKASVASLGPISGGNQ